jgi:hypothetical protein
MSSTLELLTDAVKEHINDPAVTFNFGRKHLAENGAPPRVTWVPLSGEILPARLLGPIVSTVQGRKVRIYPIYQDAVTIEAHIWAQNFERLEELHRILLGATKTLFGTDSRPSGYQLPTEQERSGYSHGEFAKAVQLFTWSTTVASTQKTTPGPDAGTKVPTRLTVQILGSTHACSINNTL